MRIDIPPELIGNAPAHLTTLAPEITEAGRRFSLAAYGNSILSLREFEAARMRTAQVNGCELCMNFRAERDLPGLMVRKASSTTGSGSVATHGPAPDEAFYESIAHFRTAPNLSVREALAAEYAEGMGQNPHGIAQDEDFWARFKANFSEAEIVDMSYCVAAFMGMGRVVHVLGLDGVCEMPAPQEEAA